MSASAGSKERKVVTVLFADLVGFTARAELLDPEDVEAILRPYHEHLRRELERFGGTVEKFIGDAVMALFGAPKAHEDDPERAVRAALAIRDWAVEEAALEVRIAVTTGEALVSLGARPESGEGMAAGDVVNTAARLQAAAPVNGILVGESTHRATRNAIDYREAASVAAKGKREPVPVWEALDARSRFGVDVSRPDRASLVGRRRELQQLRDALDRVREERAPQLVTLVGVPGIGKSRLVRELFRAVEADEELVYWRQGRSLPYGEGVTFWALGEIVKAHAGVLETDPAEVAEQKLERVVAEAVPEPGEVGWVTRHLRPLLGLGGEGEGGSDKQGEAFAAWRRFLEGLADRSPLVLVFEDLHWADTGLLDFVDELVERAADVPMIVVCTARPELLDRRPGWGGGKRNAVTISLSPLSDEDTARLLGQLLEQAVLAADVQSVLLARAEGNPLYAEEYARLFLERGRGDDLPESLQGIIAARLDALSPAEKSLAQDAAVVGKVFWLGALAAVGGVEAPDADEALRRLERKELVRRQRRSSIDGETEFAFHHLLVRDVAYSQIPRAARAEKHQCAAAWIELLARREDHAEMLAHHYSTALELKRAAREPAEPVYTWGVAGKARVAMGRLAHTEKEARPHADEPLPATDLEQRAGAALREAGDRALALNAFAAAADFYEQAAGLVAAADPTRAELLLRLGKALFYAAAGAEEPLEEAYALFVAADAREPAAQAAAWLGTLYQDEGRADAAQEQFRRARELVEGLPASRPKGEVLGNVSRSLMMAGQHEESIMVGQATLEIAAVLGAEELRAQALITIGSARLAAGAWAGAADIEQGIEAALAINSVESVRGYVNLASFLESFGRLREAWKARDEGESLAERLGARWFTRWLRAERVPERFFRGDWDDMLAAAAQVIQEPTFLGIPARHFRARVRLARGEGDEAVRDVQTALRLARDAEDRQVILPALSAAAFVVASAGKGAEAGRLADELISRWGERPTDFPWYWVVELAAALDLLGRGSDLLEPARVAEGGSRWLVAASALAAGDYETAAREYEDIGSRPDEAHARLRAAESLVAGGRRAEADEQLHRALAFFRSVAATRYVREGEALLAASA